MSEGASDLGKCGRTTKRNRPCTLPPVPSAPSCFNHLTADERAMHERRKAEAAAVFAWNDPDEPACWRWPILDVAVLLDITCVGLSDDVRARILAVSGGDLAVQTRQEDLCAICGRRDSLGLVLDHDHATGLIRGFLCRSCNVREAHTGGVFDLYRQRPPAVILGVREAYWSPFDTTTAPR